jgi:hypothetical protein
MDGATAHDPIGPEKEKCATAGSGADAERTTSPSADPRLPLKRHA